MSELLIVLPFCANDGVIAEHLCDYIFLLNKRVKKYHALLVADSDTHGEMREKVKIAAEVAFESVELIQAPVVVSPDKNLRINRTFMAAAEHIAKAYRMPWFWMEPDCVPLAKNWFDKITDKYFDQPKRYAGSFFLTKDAAGKDAFMMARVSCYPTNAIDDLKSFLSIQSPFHVTSGLAITPRATKTRLVQEAPVKDEYFNPMEGVVMVHGDKHSILLAKLREQLETNGK